MGKISLQTKFGVSYILVIIGMLILLNTYPILVSQNMMFKSKETAMTSTLKVVESSLSGLSRLTEENVAQAMGSLKETGASRILITDPAGRILYDSRESGGAVGLYAFYTEIVQALKGNDAFYCTYDSAAFHSRVASPVVYHSQTVGCVYAYEYDTEQATLLKSFQFNLLKISILVAGATVIISLLLSRMLTVQITELLQAIRSVREGAYSRKASVKGSDELSQIASEFNSLTDRLQATESARRRFVSDASHELKTPLAGIRLLTDSILQTDNMDEATTREFVSDIGREAERLTRISENLLRLSRLDSGVEKQAYPVSVRSVMEHVQRMLSMVAREKGVVLSSDIPSEAVVMATEDDLHQVLYNLMENGIKYSGAQGFVHVNATVSDKQVTITVEDNGIGIPEEDQKHIFERFYRVDKARSRAIGGTGLGLSIVQDTVAYRGGTISVASRSNGVGTVFTVTLPLAEPQEGDDIL